MNLGDIEGAEGLDEGYGPDRGNMSAKEVELYTNQLQMMQQLQAAQMQQLQPLPAHLLEPIPPPPAMPDDLASQTADVKTEPNGAKIDPDAA